MPRPRLHAFEGEQLTVQQIHQRVPVLSSGPSATTLRPAAVRALPCCVLTR